MIAIGPSDARYPRGLLDLLRAPDPLWIEGDPAVLTRRAIAIVGTRRLSAYGARVARELARAAAAAEVVVVSGLAQGVDSAAHEGALEGRGPTVAVLGEGLAAHLESARGRRSLSLRVRGSGALVSEFPPDAPARPWTFAERDATIAALGELTVVVEAPLDSGALITARAARRMRRPVYAVPGPIGASTSLGTNALIATGEAKALTSSAMLLEVLGVRNRGVAEEAVAVRQGNGVGIDARVLDVLAGASLDADALARRLGTSGPALATVIARLLVRGDVVVAPDGRIARR